MDIRALTVCVEYDDFLEISLPVAAGVFSEILVITSCADRKTEAVASRYSNVRLFQTDAFYEAGATFNKGAAIERGFDVLGRRGWMCVMDADIVLPAAEVTKLSGLDPECLYGAWRLVLPDPRSYSESLKWEVLSLHRDREIAGYFQVFHADASVLRNTRPWYGTDWKHAGGCDSDFCKKWPKSRWRILPFSVLHLGPVAQNWYGRATSRLDGTMPAAAEQRRQAMQNLLKKRKQSGYAGEKLSG